MQRTDGIMFKAGWRKAGTYFLALSACLGSSLGVYFSVSADTNISSQTLADAFGRVSVFGILVTLFLPFLISVILVFLHRRWLVLPLCFVKTFLFGFCSHTVTATFGHSGWLICRLLLFSDAIAMVVLLWLWHRCLDPDRVIKPELLIGCAVFFVCVAAIDYLYISPFLAALFQR